MSIFRVEEDIPFFRLVIFANNETHPDIVNYIENKLFSLSPVIVFISWAFKAKYNTFRNHIWDYNIIKRNFKLKTLPPSSKIDISNRYCIHPNKCLHPHITPSPFPKKKKHL